MSLSTQISAVIADGFVALGAPAALGEVVLSQRPDLCQFQCNGAFKAAKLLRKSPREVATAVAIHCKNDPRFALLDVAANGFLNITLTDDTIAAYCAGLAQYPRAMFPLATTPHKIVIDFGGPNIAKPMHVGHLRSSIIGDCLQRVFRALGHTVVGDIHLGDFGTQMGMLIAELQREQPELLFFRDDFDATTPTQPPVDLAALEQLYPHASARCKTDETAMRAALAATHALQTGHPGYRKLWQHFVDISIAALREDFATLGVTFDLWNGESHYQDRIAPMLAALEATGVAVPSDGSLIIPVARETDAEPMPPLLVRKSDGSALYATTDLATIAERAHDLHADLVLYVVDKRQRLHFEQLFRAAEKTGLAGGTKLEHIAFGTVNGADGKPYKTRDGNVMRLRALIDAAIIEARRKIDAVGIARESLPEADLQTIAAQIGVGALRFADLSNNRTTDYIFDLDKFTDFDGSTGPYIQYSTVRIQSILDKAAAQNLTPSTIAINDAEARALGLHLSHVDAAAQYAADLREPHHIAAYTFTLAQLCNRFYREHHILRETDAAMQSQRLALLTLCTRVLRELCGVMGIEIPQKM